MKLSVCRDVVIVTKSAVMIMVIMGMCGGEKSTEAAQPPRRREAATTESQADADFREMGEYLGLVHSSSAGQSVYGLQVVALGAGGFDGMLYPGGLPGNGGKQDLRQKLSGKLQGDQVVLTNDQWDVSVRHGTATLHRTDGELSGSLPKVKRRSRSLGASPPPEALILFDGTNVDAFRNGKIADRLLQVGTEIDPSFRDFTMHLEFKVPYMPYARGQGRGNSGVYLHSRYEVQILDSFGLDGEFNECGSLYRYRPPQLNMAFPPLSWQTYDITFQSARFDDDGNKTRDARLTVVHNGVPVHCQFQVEHKTGAGKQEGPQLLPTKLQDHGNPVEFRNIWIVDHTDRPVPLNVGTICLPQGF